MPHAFFWRPGIDGTAVSIVGRRLWLSNFLLSKNPFHIGRSAKEPLRICQQTHVLQRILKYVPVHTRQCQVTSPCKNWCMEHKEMVECWGKIEKCVKPVQNGVSHKLPEFGQCLQLISSSYYRWFTCYRDRSVVQRTVSAVIDLRRTSKKLLNDSRVGCYAACKQQAFEIELKHQTGFMVTRNCAKETLAQF